MALKSKADLIATPKVYVVGAQRLELDELYEFLEDEGFPDYDIGEHQPGEVLPETAGRLCYMSFDGGRPHDAYVEHIKDSKHGSVLEHAVVNFILTGVSRSLTHELVRHRAGWSYSQLSQRFVDESACQFVVPPGLRTEVAAAQAWLKGEFLDSAREALSPEALVGPYDHVEGTGLRWLASVERASRDYLYLSDAMSVKLSHITDKTARRKAAREAARSVLPNCTETKIFCTVNARSLRHFLEMRANEHADAEIREVAVAIYGAVLPHWPDILGDYGVYEHETAGKCLKTKHRKV